MQNRFEQFSQNIIAMHTGSAGAFDPARMMFPPEEKEASSQEMQNLYMTNVYRIQNLTEENYLYRQNFQFLTQMFEKQIHKKLYPQVERQVEKTIRQELPKAEDRVIREMTKELHTLVQESGVEQLRVLEKEAKEEQKVLLRKIENIYNSSVYVNVQAKNIQNDNISINGRVENGQKTGSAKDRNTWLRTQITSVLEQKDQQTVKNLTEEILQKVKAKDASVAIRQTERVYLEQVLEGYTEGKTDRQQTVRQAAEIIERFARRGQTERRLSEWITADPSISQPRKVQQSEKARSTQLLQWMELAAHSLQPSQHLTSPAAKAMENHPTEEVIRQKPDMAPMEHLSAPEERVTQPSQEVINQAVQSQSPQPQVGRSQDMSQPQIWTAQTLMSLQHQTSSISSTSSAAKAMESHPVEEEAIRQRTDAASMEHLTIPESDTKGQSTKGQATENRQPHVWTAQTLLSLQHTPPSVSPATKAMKSHSAEEATRQRTKMASMEHLTIPENNTETQKNDVFRAEQVQRFTPVQMLPQQSDMSQSMPPAPTQVMSQAPPSTQVMPQATTPKQAMIQAHMFPQMQQPPEVPQAASMRRSSPRLQQRTMHHSQSYVMEAAPIIYAEEPKQAADPGEHQVIRKQIREITEHIEEVKKTVAIERQVLTEQQKESVRQVIRSTPSLLTEGEIAVLMKQKVETEISRKMDESMQQMTNRVYRRIEEKLKTERERRGRI